MRIALDVRKQLSELCDRAQLTKSSCGNETEKIRKCLVYGLFRNVASLKKEGYYEVVSFCLRMRFLHLLILILNLLIFI